MTSNSAKTRSFVRRPTVTSSVLAVAFGIAAVGLLAESSGQRRPLMMAAVGAVSFTLGGRLWRRDSSAIGVIVALCGSLLLAASIGYVAIRSPQLVDRFELLPGLLGLWILAAALVPVRFRRSRLGIDVGTGLLFVSVLTSGVVHGASPPALIVAAAATILAWDAAENAVSLGGQIGSHRIATTAKAELTHVGVSGAVAILSVGVVLGIAAVGVDGLPFAALVALLVAVVALVLAPYR
ncbi:MAG: DUF7519 family protein [Halobacteriota archaeon]